jgi:hypothetical protein
MRRRAVIEPTAEIAVQKVPEDNNVMAKSKIEAMIFTIMVVPNKCFSNCQKVPPSSLTLTYPTKTACWPLSNLLGDY